MLVPYSYTPGCSLGYSAIQLSTGKAYDFNTNTFVNSPTTPVAALTEGTGYRAGSYSATQSTPSGVWTNGDYYIGFHLRTANDMQISFGYVNIYNGSDETIIPSTGVISGGSVSVTGITLDFSQPLPANPVPNSLGESLSFGRQVDATLPIRESLPNRQTVYFATR